MSKKIFALIALVLSLVVATSCPLQAFAAASSTEFVSEVRIAYGKNFEAAKKWLTDNGYTPVDADLNEDADSVVTFGRAVCIGYRTTKNPDEAVTDMKTMNMKGNYSYEAYEMVLNEQKEQISAFITQLVSSLNEYRQNYAKGLYKAKMAHDLMDKILDDDTNRTMGELLLSETVQELGDDAYAALSDEEKRDHANMVTILMQGNSKATLAIEQYLCMASDTGAESFVDRFADFGSYDVFESDYSGISGISEGTRLEKAIAAEYDDTAQAIVRGLEPFRELLEVYTGSELFGETDEDVINDYFSADEMRGEYMIWNNARAMYTSLSGVDYEDGTLYDLFTSEDYDLEDEDRYMLYPLAASLSEGQRACIEFVSLTQLFDNGFMTEEAWSESYDRMKSEIVDETPVVSAFAGIDRAVFEDGVALTNAAKQLNDSSEESCMDRNVLSSFTSTTYLFLAGFAVSTITAFYLAHLTNVAMENLNNLVSSGYEIVHFRIIMDKAERAIKGDHIFTTIALTQEDVEEISWKIIDDTFDMYYQEHYGIVEKSFCDTNRITANAQGFKIAGYVGIVACICMLIFAMFTGVSVWRDIYAYYHTEKTPIPKYIVDEVTDKDGNNTYTYYSAVRCNRQESFLDSSNEMLDEYADLNGDIGKEWLALYVTKDPAAGSPIRPEFVCQKGKNTAGRNIPLTMFGEKSAVNLVDEKYVYDDNFGGIYLFWSAGSAALTSTVSTTGTIAIIIAASVAVAAVAALLVVRKKKAAKAAQ